MRFAAVTTLVIIICLGIWFVPNWNSRTSAASIFLQDGREFDNQQIDFLMSKFADAGITNAVVQRGKIQIPARFRDECNQILGSSEFSQLAQQKASHRSGLSNPFIPPSEKARLAKEARLQQLADMLERIYGIREAEIVHDQLKSQNFNRQMIQTAAITLWAEEGETIGKEQATTARKIVCNAFAGLEEANVLVVDGDSCMAFATQSTSQSKDNSGIATQESELGAGRIQLEKEFQKLLVKFGEPQIQVRLEQEKKQVETRVALNKKNTTVNMAESGEAVANGTGSIRNRVNSVSDEQPHTETKTIVVNRLLGIEVAIQHEAVTEYIRQQMGISQEISEEQFSRGIVAVRNEITKEIVRWLRSQKGLDVGSDLVAVSILPAQQVSTESASVETPSLGTSQTLPVAVGLGALLVFLAWITGKKARSHHEVPPGNEQLSDGGRAFVSRNQTNSGRQLAEEASEVVHAAPADSARAFQNLVSGEATR